MTKKEFARLARVSRSLGHLRISGTEKAFTCPLSYEAKCKHGGRGIGTHRFAVAHAVWEAGTSVAEVTKAFQWHLDMEECDEVPPSA